MVATAEPATGKLQLYAVEVQGHPIALVTDSNGRTSYQKPYCAIYHPHGPNRPGLTAEQLVEAGLAKKGEEGKTAAAKGWDVRTRHRPGLRVQNVNYAEIPALSAGDARARYMIMFGILSLDDTKVRVYAPGEARPPLLSAASERATARRTAAMSERDRVEARSAERRRLLAELDS